MHSFDTSSIDALITGREEPQIYAFETGTIPNYLKVGDTVRPVVIRLKEWRDKYPDLMKVHQQSAMVTPEVLFRDFAIHDHLEEHGHKRLESAPTGIYYSREFFEDAKKEDVEDAIRDIQNDYTQQAGKYQFYALNDSRSPLILHYDRVADYPPRPNQQDAIDRFVSAVNAGRKNLLMYAVMRFGKSNVSIWCAKAMGARLTVVVSAKADVKDEWKKTVETHKDFTDFVFLGKDELLRNPQEIHDCKATGKKAVVFLTLQDLAGSTREARTFKTHHEELFNSEIDLLIVDETHFGARAEVYGRALQGHGLSKEEINQELKGLDTSDKELESINTLRAKIRLHLSGTPYRILMGSEFAVEDIISFVQYSDIHHEKQGWIDANTDADDWENPYFGFPQMVRFAFVPNESSRTRLEALRAEGGRYGLSELFKPQSIKKDEEKTFELFCHEREVLDLLQAIDGTKPDPSIFDFLNYDKIKTGNMCHHIVMVLPYCASCDAMEKLLAEKQGLFENLSQYKVLNISGHNTARIYDDTIKVKNAIARFEAEGQKTITLTVYKMLTGSTVEEWDTMIYLKDSASPQEYDQSVFRLQSPNIVAYERDGELVKYDKKPQTLLVDFSPDRMFAMEEAKAKIYNANVSSSGNNELEQRLEENLEISPIIYINRESLIQATPADIMDKVREYSANRSILDEATDIPVDTSLFDIPDILSEIRIQSEINAKGGLKLSPNVAQDDGTELAVPDGTQEQGHPTSQQDQSPTNGEVAADESEEAQLIKKFATYYARLLFYAFFSTADEKSLDDIIGNIDKNSRIAKNLALDKHVLELIRSHINPFTLSQLDYKIQNVNSLRCDPSLRDYEIVEHSIRKFHQLSPTEFFTPLHIARDMIDCFCTAEYWKKYRETPEYVLDFSSKSAVFLVAFYQAAHENDIPKAMVGDKLYAIPTSPIAYEFTRAVYEIMDWDVNHISETITSKDVIAEDGGDIQKRLESAFKEEEKVKFEAVVGNPPYQESDGGAGASARPIYQKFIEQAKEIDPGHISMIVPTRWFAGGKGLDDFRDTMLNDMRLSIINDYLTPGDIFPNNVRGGVCYFLWDRSHTGKTRIVTHQNGRVVSEDTRPLLESGLDIFIRRSEGVRILRKVDHSDSLMDEISPLKPFGLRTFFINSTEFKATPTGLNKPIKIYGKKKIGYVERDLVVTRKEWIDNWKVITAESNNIGTELNDDNLNTIIAKPGEICTETYIVIGADLGLNKKSAENLAKYLHTKFTRFMISLAKPSQHGTAKVYRFVPLQDFTPTSDIDWNKNIDDIDRQLFDKYSLSESERTYISENISPMLV
jgi:hypothetical protein